MNPFKIQSKYTPAGDQEQAIKLLSANLEKGKQYQTLLGVTGSGKTFTMAKVIEKVQRPTLIISHNKTLGCPALPRVQGFFSLIMLLNTL
jgi:excinuclease ABC subunit B